jgi:hypothetical protein
MKDTHRYIAAECPDGRGIEDLSRKLSVHSAYSRALLAFRLNGRSPTAEQELRNAIDVNPYVPELLCYDTSMLSPLGFSPDTFDEAQSAAEELLPAWTATPGALEWIADSWQETKSQVEKRKRAELRKKRDKLKKRKRR